MIQNIDISKIHHHPDNPRKDLGDLTELAESIKERGVLQNLTLVPIEGKEGEYYAVIGNRRLAASKLAGLTEVPGAIMQMDHKTQVATMLLENIQRSDLTPIEQAQGFQMMIDLGETVSDISGKTGFSDSTIRKRLNLVKLDQKKLQESYLRGGTLMDYVELEKIKDIKLRNKVLEYIGTSNFKWQLQNAIDEEERPARKEELLKELQEFAKPIKDSNGLLYVTGFYDFKKPEYYKKPGKRDKTEYFYKVDKTSITLYKKEEKQVKEISPQEQTFKKREAELKKLTKMAYEMRYAFVKDFNAAKKYTREIQYFAFQRLLQYGNQDIDKILEFLEIEKPDKEGLGWEAINTLKRDLLIEKYNKFPEKIILVVTYMTFGDGPGNKYYYAQNYGDFKIKYNKNETLDIIYSTLLDLGYEMSDEEKALQNGTHELFDKPKPEETSTEPVAEKSLTPCNAATCPFYAYETDREGGCGYCGDEDDENVTSDLLEAVELHKCKNEAVMKAYNEI